MFITENMMLFMAVSRFQPVLESSETLPRYLNRNFGLAINDTSTGESVFDKTKTVGPVITWT